MLTVTDSLFPKGFIELNLDSTLMSTDTRYVTWGGMDTDLWTRIGWMRYSSTTEMTNLFGKPPLLSLQKS